MSISGPDRYSDAWNQAYREGQEKGRNLAYPSETLVRIFKGDYLTGKYEDMRGRSVLDIGCGTGNNALFLASLGMHVSGTEIHANICRTVHRTFQEHSFTGDFRVGTNRDIPFPDDSFDYIVSWNVLHYEGEETNIQEAIKEYHRVLKPGGTLVLSTTAPEHKILINAQAIDSHVTMIHREDDFRAGQCHFIFKTEEDFHFYFSPPFKNLQIGRIEDVLFREKLDWWLLSAAK